MTSDWAEIRTGIDAMAQRSRDIATSLEAARTQPLTGVSDDGSITAVAAGGRLVGIDAPPSAAHDDLVAAMLQAARAALTASNRATADAAAAALATGGPT